MPRWTTGTWSGSTATWAASSGVEEELGGAPSDEDDRDARAPVRPRRMPSDPPTRPITIQGRRMPSRDEVRSLILPKNGLPTMDNRAPIAGDQGQAVRRLFDSRPAS